MIYINLLIIFLLIIFIHELGHYCAARLFNAQVTDFSIGFGKSIYNFVDKNNTNWKISLIPLGGYVKIKGLDTIFQKESKSGYEIGSFQSLNLFEKIVILLAGSFFNIISAWLFLLITLFFVGIVSYTSEVGEVMKDSPASINDIQKGDIITSINNQIINEFNDIPKAIGSEKFISIDLLRGNTIITKKFELKFNSELQKYLIGISSTNTPSIKRYLFFESFSQSLYFIPNYYLSTYKYLKQSINNNTITKDLSGPIGIVKMADQLMLDKIKGIVLLFIVIPLFVGIFNLIPVPLLDGGHIVYFIIRRIFSDSLPEFVTKIYLIVGFTIISFLFLVVTFNDIFYK